MSLWPDGPGPLWALRPFVGYKQARGDILGPSAPRVLEYQRSHNFCSQTKERTMVLVAVSQGPRGFLGAQSNDWVSGCTIRSQSWSILFKFMGEEESMEESAWLTLRSNSASDEAGGEHTKVQIPVPLDSFFLGSGRSSGQGEISSSLTACRTPRHPNLHPYSF